MPTADQLQDFVDAFFEAALWSQSDQTNDQGGDPLDKNYSFEDIDEASVAPLVAECHAFATKYADEIGQQSRRGDTSNYGRAGHYFLLTRNEIGASFLDGDWPAAVEKTLDDAASKYPQANFSVGDDGKLYCDEYHLGAHLRYNGETKVWVTLPDASELGPFKSRNLALQAYRAHVNPTDLGPAPSGSGLDIDFDGLGATPVSKRARNRYAGRRRGHRMSGLGATRIKREPVRNLRPLTTEQVNWLTALGVAAAEQHVTAKAAWWPTYFGVDYHRVDWSAPFVNFEPEAYMQLLKDLQEAMTAARDDHDKIFEMMRAGQWPPGQPTVLRKGVDPFKLPEWLEYWQAENAFRRGYQTAWDAETLRAFEQELRGIIQRHKTFHPSQMRRSAESFEDDPATAQFIRDFADAFEAGTVAKAIKFSDLARMLTEYRDQAYIQFSPYFFPERGHGAGFFGVGSSGDDVIDAEFDEPQDDDAFISPCGNLGGSLCVSVGGKSLGKFREWDDALLALEAHFQKTNYFPNVWFIDDHGGVRPVDMSSASGLSLSFEGARKRRKRRKAS